MNCQNERIQELIDGALPAMEAARAENHLRACAACAWNYRWLQTTCRSLSRLPRHVLSAAFNAKVFAALDIEARRRAIPLWAAWTVGAVLSWTSCWLAVLVFAARGQLRALHVLKACALLAHPVRAAECLKLGAAKAALLLAHGAAAASNAAGALAGAAWNSPLPLQLVVATVLSGLMIASISNQRTRQWRHV